MDVKLVQSKKAEGPMLVTLLGMIVFKHPIINVFVAVLIIALQLLRESYIELPFSTTIVVRLVQLWKAEFAMLVTPQPMDTYVRLLQPSKALLPMLLTELPITYFVT